MAHSTPDAAAQPEASLSLGLYRGILGDCWDRLDPAVRSLHPAGPLTAEGLFDGRRDRGVLALVMARALRLPPTGNAMRTHLTVTPGGGGELWVRRFGGHVFETRQWRTSDGLLAEHVGPFVLFFRLEAVNGGLVYRQAGAGVRLGPLNFGLPRWLQPEVAASESASGDGGVRVSVEVRAPFAGLVSAYCGSLERVGATD